MNNSVRPFDDIRHALRYGESPPANAALDGVRADPGRIARTGIPEVVLAERKSTSEVVTAMRQLATRLGSVVASRCPDDMVPAVVAELADAFAIETVPLARAVIARRPDFPLATTGGRIAVLAAGTSDRPIAAEAALIAREMGVAVIEITDVGVAGLHRLVQPLESAIAEGIDAIVVAAGMDGALPSVVAGLVAVPVIGLPTSVGYGFGGGGVGALTTMLQSCAPGLSVVNIDNGIGAGATAALIANRVAAARAEQASG